MGRAETQWLDIVIAMVDTLRDDHPMSTVLICFLLDTFAIPTAEAMELLSLKFLKRVKRGTARRRARARACVRHAEPCTSTACSPTLPARCGVPRQPP